MTRLNLIANNLTGGAQVLSSHVHLESFCSEIVLMEIFDAGTLPPNYGNLRSLHRLYLSGNNLTGVHLCSLTCMATQIMLACSAVCTLRSYLTIRY